MMGTTSELARVQVNGCDHDLSGVNAHTTTLEWLRGIGLTGAKEGCAEGECGACAVLVARPGVDAATEWTAVNSCLVPIAALDGQEVLTSEGLVSSDALHPVQRELATRGGSQCGYCTPGFVCALAAEFYRPSRAPRALKPEEREQGSNGVDLHALSGNLCRCTGYRPIRDAAFALGAPDSADALAARAHQPPPQHPHRRIGSDSGDFIRPKSLEQALSILVSEPATQVLAGGTDWGVEVNLRGKRVDAMLAIDALPELRKFEVGPESITLGAALCLTEIERRLHSRVPLLAQAISNFASRLIRNSATIGGNLGTGSPIADTPPALLALGARVVLVSHKGEREVPLEDYFTGYRSTVREAAELIASIRIPLPLAPIAQFHKVAKRRFDDISSVAVGYAIGVSGGVITDVKIGLGGVAATPLRARETERALLGRPWQLQSIEHASQILRGEGTPIDDHRASAAYRSAMLGQSLHRLFHTTAITSEEDGR